MARLLFGAPRLVVLEILSGHDLDVYRIVRSDNPDDPVFLNSLKSHYELSEPPRKVERRSTAVHMGISVHTNRSASAGTASRWPQLGTYTARFTLQPGYGFNYAHTGPIGHLTVWADPVKLHEVLVDIEPVDE